MASSSGEPRVPELPLFIVHSQRNDSGHEGRGGGDTSGMTAGTSTKSNSQPLPSGVIVRRRKPRKKEPPAEIEDGRGEAIISQDGVHTIWRDADEHGAAPRYDKWGKPTRRYLASEIERLFKKNLEFARQLKIKEDAEASLSEAKNRLETELDELRKKSSHSREEALRLRNRELAQDVFLMKNILVRLNAELEKSQDRVRQLKTEVGLGGDRAKSDDPPTLSEDSGIGETARRGQWLKTGEAGVLAPLLRAYDEALREKESLVGDYKHELDRVAGACKEVMAENEALRFRLDEVDKKGEVTYSDWLALQKEVLVTREQNELLARQAKLAHAKFQELRSAFQTKLNECCSERDEALEQSQASRTELFILKGRYSCLQEECQRLKGQLDTKIPQSVHMASINECKRLFEELKSRYEEERETTMKRSAALESAASDRDAKLATLTAERDKLVERNNCLETSIKRLEAKLDESQRRMAEAEGVKEKLRRELAGAVAFSGELVAAQESLMGQLGRRTEEAGMAARLANRLDAIKSQIQGVERQVSEQMSALDQELRTKALSLQRLREEQAREVVRLRELIQAKEETIQRLEAEKKKTQDELELVWKAATNPEQTRQQNDE